MEELRNMVKKLPKKAEFVCLIGGEEFPVVWYPAIEAEKSICIDCGGFRGSDRVKKALSDVGYTVKYCQCIPEGHWRCPDCGRDIRDGEYCRWSDCSGGGAAYCNRP
jgi:hypothetical protein